MSNTIELIEQEEINNVWRIRAIARVEPTNEEILALKKEIPSLGSDANKLRSEAKKKKQAAYVPTEDDITAVQADFPEMSIGDTVNVFVRVTEGTRERLQNFGGIVIAKKNGGVRETFTVRRLSYGIGVERTFPVYSTKIDHIEIVRHGRVRRAKLYYLRDRKGKSAKLKEIKK